jgi:HSP20 family molecular chaperone IbpA
MIDDDFESVFRRMIDQFMESFGAMPKGSIRVRSWNDSFVDETPKTQIDPMSDEPLVEKIDLEDGDLIVIDRLNDVEDFKVKVAESKIFVQHSPDRKEITIEVGFPIDLEKSTASYRNGVLEITAIKANTNVKNISDGFLRID